MSENYDNVGEGITHKTTPRGQTAYDYIKSDKFKKFHEDRKAAQKARRYTESQIKTAQARVAEKMK